MNDELRALGELLWMLVTDPGTGMLLALLVAAAVIDWRTMRIPNWLTASGVVYGLMFNATHATSIAAGLAHAAGGLAVALALLLPLWLLRVMGAGDVKLVAMVGSFLGAGATMTALLFVVVAGGVAAIAVTLSRGTFGRMVQNLRFILTVAMMPASRAWRPETAPSMPTVGRLPYGISICVGTVTFLGARLIGLV